MIRFQVLLTKDAARALNEIYDYIFDHDSRAKAKKSRQEHWMGFYPKEPLVPGIREYRQVFFKSHRTA